MDLTARERISILHSFDEMLKQPLATLFCEGAHLMDGTPSTGVMIFETQSSVDLSCNYNQGENETYNPLSGTALMLLSPALTELDRLIGEVVAHNPYMLECREILCARLVGMIHHLLALPSDTSNQ